jgi:hypothetical protein
MSQSEQLAWIQALEEERKMLDPAPVVLMEPTGGG